MLVPGHIVSFYVATCGQNGAALGSDEKEIIVLVYVIIDAATTQIVDIKQYLVRPFGHFGKERLTEPTSPSSNSEGQQQALTPTTQQPDAELPIAVAQAAGKPLNEVIEQFDTYIRSLSSDPELTNFRIVTDGQLPIRQCLHPEACAKEIELPSYYCRFSDLRKEFVRFKAADLSKALVPVKDIKKLPQMPTLPPLPASIADMMKELELTAYEGQDFYLKESRDMVTVIQSLLAAGHKFEANEIVNLNLEPGICSIDDEIDGSCIVRARGLPWQSSDQDIAKFFRGLNVAKGGVALCLSPLGRRNGEALIRFVSQEHRDMALKRHKHHIGNRYIEVYRATGEDFLAVAGGASNEAQAFLSKGAQVIIRMRGLPYDCTAKQVLDFFTNGENPCTVLDGTDGVLFVKKPDGRATGDAFVLFANESDAPKALSRHRESIGQRYIELFRSTTAEVQQVLNRSMDPKTYETPQPPLIAQLPAVQMPLLPQHVITSGTTKNCIRLRGLPYEARVEHILHFLEDFANNILYQGVHMVYNAQGQPSGEAFIQMDSEEAARASAQQKHTQYMIFGKKYRYIEVFQCSGDDMNLVLNGGLQTPTNPTKPPLLSPGMLPQPQPATPQLPATQISSTLSHHSQHLPTRAHAQYIHTYPAAAAAAVAAATPSQSHAHSAHSQHAALQMQHAQSTAVAPSLTISIPPPSQAMLAQQQAQFIAQQSLIARQQAAAAAAAAHNEQLLYPNMALFQSAAANAVGLQTAASAHAANAGPQYIFMPRQYIHPFHMGFIPSHLHSLPLTAATAPPAATVNHPLQSSLTGSIKRSYEAAFQQDATSSATKRPLTRPATSLYAPFYQ